jgi:hypothetical protein
MPWVLLALYVRLELSARSGEGHLLAMPAEQGAVIGSVRPAATLH